MDLTYWLLILIILVIILLTGNIIKHQHEELQRLRPKYKSETYKFDRKLSKGISMNIMDDMDGVTFENLCCEILHKQGFNQIQKTAVTGDFGVDILCVKDGVKYAVQCKCYRKPIGVDAIQEVFAGCAYYDCDVPIVMTNNYFTDASQELARVIGVTLWSRHYFVKVLSGIKKGNKRSNNNIIKFKMK